MNQVEYICFKLLFVMFYWYIFNKFFVCSVGVVYEQVNWFEIVDGFIEVRY